MFRFALSYFEAPCLFSFASKLVIYLYFNVLTLRAGVHSAVLSYRERVTNGHMLTLGMV